MRTVLYGVLAGVLVLLALVGSFRLAAIPISESVTVAMLAAGFVAGWLTVVLREGD